MRTLKLLIALTAVATAAACGSPDDDRSAVDTLVPPPTGEVQDPPPPGATTSTSDVASSGPVLSTTSTTVPLGAPSTSSSGRGSSTASSGATGTTRAGSATETSSATGATETTGATGTTNATGTTAAAQTSTTTRGSATTRPSGPTATTSPTTIKTPSKKSQTISFAQPIGPWAYGEQKVILATASSRLPVAFEAAGACVVDDALLGVFRATDVGTCKITASQNGDGAWQPATPETLSIATSQAKPKIQGFVGRTIEYPRSAFSIPLTASTNEGAVVKFRMQVADDNDFCTVEGAELRVPVTQGLPRTCRVEAYVLESPFFAETIEVADFEITPTVVEFVDNRVVAVSDTSVTVWVRLNRKWDILASADCSPTSHSKYGAAEYELTFAVQQPAEGEEPCTITAITVSLNQVDGAFTSENPELIIAVP